MMLVILVILRATAILRRALCLIKLKALDMMPGCRKLRIAQGACGSTGDLLGLNPETSFSAAKP